MKQMSLTTIAVGASTFACAALLSFGWSEQRGVSLSVENAQAQVQNRRAAYGGGTAEMRRYGNGPNNLGGLVGGDDPGTGGGAAGAVAAARGPYYQRAGYYAGGPYYGGSVRGASASYYGGYPSGAWGGVSSSDRDLYIRNLHDSGLAR